jgi:thioester reductase-like protein
LITGATGVIGSELVPLFLQTPDFRIRLLIRASSPEHLQKRMEELFAYWELDPTTAHVDDRLEAIAGDVCLPNLGLDRATYDRLAGEVTHVIHSAGNVKLNHPLEQARADAVGSGRNVVAFAWGCQQHGRLEKVDVVSTVGVAGRMSGLIPERRLSESRQFHNTYEQAKAEAEAFLFGELDKGLPLTIHRPSMVVGRSDNGKVIRKQVFYYLCEFLSGKKTWGFLPDFGDARLDIIPVDYVAQAIHIAARHPDTIGQVFHLCSGPDQALPLAELRDCLRSGAEQHGDRLPRSKTVTLFTLRALLSAASCLAWGRARRTLRALPHFLAYLDEPQAFDNSHTISRLGLRNVPPTRCLISLLNDHSPQNA